MWNRFKPPMQEHWLTKGRAQGWTWPATPNLQRSIATLVRVCERGGVGHLASAWRLHACSDARGGVHSVVSCGGLSVGFVATPPLHDLCAWITETVSTHSQSAQKQHLTNHSIG